MCKDVPVIFSAPMVRAQLSGRKTMTRRLLYTARDGRDPGIALKDADLFDRYPPGPAPKDQHWRASGWHRRQKGDRLWVRENFAYVGTCDPGFLTYGATYPDDLAKYGCENVPATLKEAGYKWKPSIHMPREVSRLTWIINAPKIERLCDISTEDAEAEGVFAWRETWSTKQAAEMFLHGTEAAHETDNGSVAQRLFYLLWSSIHGRDSWRWNPWVVAISARVIQANVDAPEARAAA